MRIGFDVSQTGPKKAGCGFYADGLVSTLIRSDRENQYVLYPTFGEHFYDPEINCAALASYDHVSIGLHHRSQEEARRFWTRPPDDFEEQLGNPDIVHANNFFAPLELRQTKLVYTLYDLSFLENHAWTTEANRTGCFAGVFRASICADWLISISDYTKRRFLEVYPHYPADRITVIYPASRFSDLHPEKAPASRLERRRFWLSVGTLEPRKNYIGVLRAYAELRRRIPETYPLAIVGGHGWLMKGIESELQALQLTGSVIFLGYVDDAELCWLYRNARCLIYPSLYEGFGMPVLETMSCGTPAIASGGSAFPEIMGGCLADNPQLLLDPRDSNSIADAMQSLAMTSESELDRLGNMARARARTFSWSASAQSLLEVYRGLRSLPKAFS